MTVYELIQQLQDCEMPDAEVRIIVRSKDDAYMHGTEINQVYYSSLVDNTVIVGAREQ